MFLFVATPCWWDMSKLNQFHSSLKRMQLWCLDVAPKSAAEMSTTLNRCLSVIYLSFAADTSIFLWKMPTCNVSSIPGVRSQFRYLSVSLQSLAIRSWEKSSACVGNVDQQIMKSAGRVLVLASNLSSLKNLGCDVRSANLHDSSQSLCAFDVDLPCWKGGQGWSMSTALTPL